MVRNISAALNAFRGLIMVNAQNDDLRAIAKLMKEQLFKNNTLQDYIGGDLTTTTRSQSKNFSDEDIEFPKIDWDILQSSFFDVWQSKTYTEEHLDENGNYVIQVALENSEVSCYCIQSRHFNAIH